MANRSITTMALFLPAIASQEDRWQPSADLYKSTCSWLVKLDLAGVQADDVRIELSGTKLSISGRRRDRLVNEDWSPYWMEIPYIRFERIIELPCLLERPKMKVEMREGMLLIYLANEGEER